MAITIRAATPHDAADMAVLVDIAGHGLPAWLWGGAAKRGEAYSALEVGRSRALREEGAFSWRNARIAEIDTAVAGLLVGYREPDYPEDEDLNQIDPILRSLVQLEALASSTWYINVLAVYAEFRGRGVGSALIGEAERLAREANASGLSLIMQDDNGEALRVYVRHGFETAAARPYVPFAAGASAKNWLLMTKPLA